MITALRSLYVILIVANSGVNPAFSTRQIWDEMKDALSDDTENPNDPASCEAAYNAALVDIRRRLARHGRTLDKEGPTFSHSPITLMISQAVFARPASLGVS